MKTEAIRPPSIGRGDTVAVVAPAGPVKREDLDSGLCVLEPIYRMRAASGLLSSKGYLAGDDQRRRQEFQEAISDPEVKGVLAARGGFGTTRILDLLDFTPIATVPKWLVGSSDFTAVLMHVWARYRLLSIHGPMVAALGQCEPDDLKELTALLEGRRWTPPRNLIPVFSGTAQGPLIGGNLTLLSHMCGSMDPSIVEGAILFIEDVGERPYRLDRCLVQLRRSGFLERVAGVITGDFTQCSPGPDGVTAEESMAANLSRIGVPVASGYPAAHGKRNYPFIHGDEVELAVSSSAAVLTGVRSL